MNNVLIDTILTAVSAIIIIAAIVILIFKIHKYRINRINDQLDTIKDELDSINLTNSITEKVVTTISDKDSFEENAKLPTYKLFEDYNIPVMYNTIMAELEEEYPNVDKEKMSDILMRRLNSPLTRGTLKKYYNAYNIKDAEKIEKEAIEYNNTFGKEPDGDPVLHSNVPNNDDNTTEENSYASIEELVSTGTVEDIEEP